MNELPDYLQKLADADAAAYFRASQPDATEADKRARETARAAYWSALDAYEDEIGIKDDEVTVYYGNPHGQQKEATMSNGKNEMSDHMDDAENFFEEAFAIADEIEQVLESAESNAGSVGTNLASIQGMLRGLADDAQKGELALDRDLAILNDITENTGWFADDVMKEVDDLRAEVKRLRTAVSEGLRSLSSARMDYDTAALNDFLGWEDQD